MRVTNNHFSTRYLPKCGFYGPAAYVESALASGNVWHETGEPIEL